MLGTKMKLYHPIVCWPLAIFHKWKELLDLLQKINKFVSPFSFSTIYSILSKHFLALSIDGLITVSW